MESKVVCKTNLLPTHCLFPVSTHNSLSLLVLINKHTECEKFLKIRLMFLDSTHTINLTFCWYPLSDFVPQFTTHWHYQKASNFHWKMSSPTFDQFQQQQPPPLLSVTHHHHVSIGPAIGALAVIMVLGAIAVMIGRFCSGKRVMNHRHYDFDGWVETTCSSCIDGRLDAPPPCTASHVTVEGVGVPSQGEMTHHQHWRA